MDPSRMQPRDPSRYNPFLTVQDLLIPGTKLWNHEALHWWWFTDESVAYAIHTPLIYAVQQDMRLWWPERNGHFTVRSAYNLCITRILDASHATSAGDWSRIWKLKVPPKVANFLWRTCRNCLPTKENLRSRNIAVEASCPVCGDAAETDKRAMFHCLKARNCWRALSMEATVNNVNEAGLEFKGSMFAIVHNMSSEQQRIFAMTTWSLWYSRNKKVWEGLDESHTSIIARGKTLLDEWDVAHSMLKPQSLISHSQAITKWTKPPPGIVKCNVDAAFSENNNRVGFGMCIRDEYGFFMAAKIVPSNPLLAVKLGEAMGLRYAMEWAKELGVEDVIFELDSKVVVDDLKSNSVDATEYGFVIRDCFNVLSSSFQNSHVEFSKRHINMVAHSLAKVVVDSAMPQVFYDIPTCIEPYIWNDMN